MALNYAPERRRGRFCWRIQKPFFAPEERNVYSCKWLFFFELRRSGICYMSLLRSSGIMRNLYARHTKIWVKWYGTGSGSDLVVSGTALSEGTRSLPLPVPYQREFPSNPHLSVPLI